MALQNRLIVMRIVHSITCCTMHTTVVRIAYSPIRVVTHDGQILIVSAIKICRQCLQTASASGGT